MHRFHHLLANDIRHGSAIKYFCYFISSGAHLRRRFFCSSIGNEFTTCYKCFSNASAALEVFPRCSPKYRSRKLNVYNRELCSSTAFTVELFALVKEDLVLPRPV